MFIREINQHCHCHVCCSGLMIRRHSHVSMGHMMHTMLTAITVIAVALSRHNACSGPVQLLVTSLALLTIYVIHTQTIQYFFNKKLAQTRAVRTIKCQRRYGEKMGVDVSTWRSRIRCLIQQRKSHGWKAPAFFLRKPALGVYRAFVTLVMLYAFDVQKCSTQYGIV